MRAKRKTKPRPPRKAPKLEAWQRVLFEAVTRPVSSDFKASPKWRDGRSAAAVLSRIIKPSATLSAMERAEIYNRMYWFRVLDGLAEDFPGLRAHFGTEAFDRLCRNYLQAYPSRSYTLRDLGARLPAYLRKIRAGVPAVEIARYEWAQIVAFDGACLPVADPASLSPKSRFALQPYLTLLRVRHPVDDHVLEMKEDGVLRGGASNARIERSGRRQARARQLLRKETLHLAVHRYEGRLYRKRLEPRAAGLLRLLGNGVPLQKACERAMKGSPESGQNQAAQIQEWFRQWFGLGWLCKAPRKKSRE